MARVDERVAELRSRCDVVGRFLGLVRAVQFSSGHRYDLDRLGALCQDNDILFVVDGTQAVGAVTVDVTRSHIDLLAVSAHKWLLGPFGIGFVALSERAMQRLRPPTVGWLSVSEPFEFDYQLRLAPDGRRFEPGTENAAGILGLGAAVDLLLDYGPDRVEDTVLANTDHLADLLRAHGVAVAGRESSRARSGIVVTTGHDEPTEAVHARLVDAGVMCSQRGTGIRFAPHVFTSPDDLQRAARATERP